MRALGNFLIVLIQGKNCFEGFVTIEANVIVYGHGDLPWEAFAGIVRPPVGWMILFLITKNDGVILSGAVLQAERRISPAEQDSFARRSLTRLNCAGFRDDAFLKRPKNSV
jgi:hypothetical protein